MKHTILAIISLLVIGNTSFAQIPNTTKDSVAHALGTVYGYIAYGRDTTNNHSNVLIKGLKDGFSGVAKNNIKELEAYITGAKMAIEANEIDSTMDINILIAGFTDSYNRKLPGEKENQDSLNQIVVNYIESRNYEKFKTYFDKIDKIKRIKIRDSGLRYKISQIGDTSRVQESDTVISKFTAYNINDKVVESSEKFGKNLKCTKGEIIAGFYEALTLVGKGGKITAWVPGDLAYGYKSRLDINTNPVKFEIEVIDIIRYNPMSKHNYSECYDEDLEGCEGSDKEY